jgi:hypothetical protein
MLQGRNRSLSTSETDVPAREVVVVANLNGCRTYVHGRVVVT